MTDRADSNQGKPPQSEPPAHHDGLIENADVATSSEDYARRFAGSVGRWFLDTQTKITLSLLGALPGGATVLDVGGGHAQVARPLIEAGYEVAVVGSHSSCAARLQPWISAGRCRFQVVDLRALPYPDQSFDVSLCFRLLPHSVDWKGLIAELCRVSARSVIIDYPSVRSFNFIASRLFKLKQAIELNTRPFTTFRPDEIHAAFASQGFRVTAEQPQFLVPMVVHRLANRALFSRAIEVPGRVLGLTRWLGSPVIIRADRRTPLV